MIGYIIIIIIIGIIVSIITEQMLIRRLRLEEGVIISKGKCSLKPGYGLIPESTTTPTIPTSNNQDNQDVANNFSGIGRNNLTNIHLNKFYKPLIPATH